MWRRELIQKAQSAPRYFHFDHHYIFSEDKVQIVDQFTGGAAQRTVACNLE